MHRIYPDYDSTKTKNQYAHETQAEFPRLSGRQKAITITDIYQHIHVVCTEKPP